MRGKAAVPSATPLPITINTPLTGWVFVRTTTEAVDSMSLDDKNSWSVRYTIANRVLRYYGDVMRVQDYACVHGNANDRAKRNGWWLGQRPDCANNISRNIMMCTYAADELTRGKKTIHVDTRDGEKDGKWVCAFLDRPCRKMIDSTRCPWT